MGVWGEIKHAVNSTLGTSNFKSLDQIITGEKAFVGSNNTLVALKDLDTREEVLCSFTPKVSGTIRLFGVAQHRGTTSTGYVYFRVNGVSHAVVIGTVDGQVDYFVDINVSAGQTYQIKGHIKGGSDVQHCTANIGGIVVDSNYYDYEI